MKKIARKIKKVIGKAFHKIEEYGKLVMFSHTIFSLSFAAVAFLLASGGIPSLHNTIWAVLAFLGARTGANALNRVIDAKIDSKNPRTANRQIPKGEVGIKETLVLTAGCFFILVVSAYQLNMVCFLLSPLALICMCVYSYTKRFTWLCHLFLGATCGIAPVGAWLAVNGNLIIDRNLAMNGKLVLIPLLLGAINCLWTAGFDIIYGSQDYEFDKANGLYSIPVRFGVAGGLKISTLFHGAALILLGVFGWLSAPVMGLFFWIGWLIIALLMIIQHKLVNADNLDKVNIASYSISQITSLVLLFCGAADILF